MLKQDEKIRYARQIGIEDWGEPAQERLKEATVFVAGLGGLGSVVTGYLAAAGIGHLRLCDPGRLDLSNLNRQLLYTTGTIGMLKSELARDRLHKLNPDIEITVFNEAIDRENVRRLAGDADILVDCLDHYRSRLVLNAYCVETGFLMVHGGIDRLFGQVTMIHPPATPCLQCLYREIAEESELPVLGAIAGIVGSIQALEVIKYVTGQGTLLKERMIFIDGKTLQFHESGLSRDPECPVCGKKTIG